MDSGFPFIGPWHPKTKSNKLNDKKKSIGVTLLHKNHGVILTANFNVQQKKEEMEGTVAICSRMISSVTYHQQEKNILDLI